MSRPDRFDRRLEAQRRELAAKKPNPWQCAICHKTYVVPALARSCEEKPHD